MAAVATNLRNLFEAYKKWVAENPQTVNDFESAAKWISYIVAGRISDSSVASELIYSLSNILVMFNDRIIEKANEPAENNVAYRIKVMLTTLEYCEVLIEISAKKLLGVKGKWFFVIIVQGIKAVGRFLLFNRFSENIIRSPPLPVLNRKILLWNGENSTSGYAVGVSQTFSFCLKRSGRVMRKVEGAPPLQYRNWKAVTKEESTQKLDLAIAEYIYIAKPLIHLLSMGAFGSKHWKCYSVSVVLDLISIQMYYRNRQLLSKKQKVELSRRSVNLLLYLLRSPCYDKITKRRLDMFLNAIANNIPFARIVCNPLIQYIAHWQNTYFYMWGT